MRLSMDDFVQCYRDSQSSYSLTSKQLRKQTGGKAYRNVRRRCYLAKFHPDITF